MKLRSLTIAILALVLGMPLFLSGQSQSTLPDQYIDPESMIQVSNELYSEIKNWLAVDDIPLNEYLYSTEIGQSEINAFLSKYSSESASNYKSGSCNCAAVRPALNYQYSSVGTDQHQDRYEEIGDPGWDLNGKVSQVTTRLNDGPGTKLRLRVQIDDARGESKISVKNAFLQLEFLNLCTVMFDRNTECFCDKFLQVQSRFYYAFDYEGNSRHVLWGNHGHEGNLSFSFGTFVLQMEPTNNGSSYFKEMTMSNLNKWNATWNFNYNSPIPGAINLAAAVANTIWGVAEVGGNGAQTRDKDGNVIGLIQNLTDLKDAISNFAPGHNISKDPVPSAGESADLTVVNLRSNIPVMVLHCSSTSITAGAYGSSGASEVNFSSTIQTTHLIPFNDYGYDPNDETTSKGECCNENYGLWYHTEDYAKITLPILRNDIMNRLNGIGQYEWNHVLPIQPGQAIPGTTNKPNLVTITEKFGQVESNTMCKCEGLTVNGVKLTPRIGTPQFEFCSEPFDLVDITYGDLMSLQPNATSTWKRNGITVGTANSQRYSVTSPGTYELIYQDVNTSYCVTKDVVVITECNGKTGEIFLKENDTEFTVVNPFGDAHFTLYDLNGRIVYTIHTQSSEINISKSIINSNGLYMFKILNNETGEEIIEKIVLLND